MRKLLFLFLKALLFSMVLVFLLTLLSEYFSSEVLDFDQVFNLPDFLVSICVSALYCFHKKRNSAFFNFMDNSSSRSETAVEKEELAPCFEPETLER